MKTLISTLLITICVLINAQTTELMPLVEIESTYVPKTWYDKWGKKVAITLYQVSTVALGAIGDGLNDDGYKTEGHILKAAEVAALISGPFVFKMGKGDYVPYIATYIGWRIIGYDYVYNATRSLPLSYIGDSSLWDKALQKQQPQGIVFARAMVAMVTIAIPIKYF